MDASILKKNEKGEMERVPHLPTDSELNKCYIVCDSEWTPNDVDQFKNLVRQSYGYRLYLDDLPSKTMYKHKGNAGHNILSKTIQNTQYNLRGNRWANEIQKGKNFAKRQSPDFEETQAWEEKMKQQLHSRSP